MDIKRGVCKCRTLEGKTLTNVTWMRPIGSSKELGSNGAPLPGEYVYLSTIQGMPLIVGSKALVGYGSTIRASISGNSSSDEFEDEYNLSVMDQVNRAGGSMPEDQVPGDQTITNDRGGVAGLLRSGSWIAKVSPLAQIFMSRFDDLVRIVARNYEQFSDTVLRVQVNAKGKLYQYTSYFRSPGSSLNETPDYYEIVGHVEAGEEAKDSYLSVDVSSVSGETVKKQVIPEHYEHTLQTTGESYTKVYSGGDTAVEQVSPTEWKFIVGQSTFNIKAEEIFGDTPKLVINVTGDATITVGGNAETNVSGNHNVTVGGNETRTIAGNLIEQVAGTRMVQVGGAVTEVSGGPWTITGAPTIIP